MVMEIEYPNGHMKIFCNEFFPNCSQVKFKKLLKVIDMDWQHKEEHLQFLEKYFKGLIENCENKRTTSGKKYLQIRQKISDVDAMLTSRKKPNGVKLTASEIKNLKEELKNLRAEQSDSLKWFNAADKYKQKYIKFVEILMERK